MKDVSPNLQRNEQDLGLQNIGGPKDNPMCLAGGEELDGKVNYDFPVYWSFVPDPGCLVSRAFASLGFWFILYCRG